MKIHITLLLSILTSFQISAQNVRSAISFAEAPFFHGVASGDPLPNQVMIWTKVTPPAGNITEVDVYWQIATDTAFLNVVNFGKTKTTDQRDFTLKIDVCGLQPNTYYYYSFKALGKNSIIGRTKTAPVGNHSKAKYAVASCSNYEHGFFNGYESMYNRNDLDAVIHLGDYYYEYKTGGFSSSVITDTWGRTVLPTNEAINLDDYRARHSHYKLDNQLQMAHQLYPFITTWDDHETANDSYKDGAGNHDPATEGPWVNRKVSSIQAYDEWMPIRTDTATAAKVWRKLRYGNLLDLIIIDSRLWGRDLQDMSKTNNANHKLLGDDQFAWLEEQLADTTTKWKIICNQMMMAPLEIFGIAVNSDQWDGYNYERQRLINYLAANNIKNTIVLTGDIHTSWINNVEGPSSNVATEFVVTSLTSPGLDVIETALGQLPQWALNLFGGSVPALLKSFNQHMKYINIQDHGYMVFTVDGNKAQGDYVFIEREDTIFSDDFGASYYTANNVSSMVQAPTYLALGTGPIKPSVYPNQNMAFAMLRDTIYATVTENNVLNGCVVTASNVCPNITATLIENATFGNAFVNNFCYTFQAITNYYGQQSFTVQYCNNATIPATCDTVVVMVDIIGVNDVTEYTFNIMNDSVLVDCPIFNDLTTNINTISSYGGSGSGTLVITNNNCIEFTPDSTFTGVDAYYVYACDNNGICDTVIFNFIIDGNLNTQVVHLYGNAGQLLSNCLNYDELQGSIVSKQFIYNGVNGNALVYSDTCVSYKSNPLFNGIDTAVMIACDNYTPQLCDTIIYYFHITHHVDTVIPPVDTVVIDTTTAIRELENNQFAVLGIYPNPFDVEIVIQYYQFSNDNIGLKLFDFSGKMIYNETINDKTIGLKYARLRTEELPRGAYILEINNGQFSYTKKLIK